MARRVAKAGPTNTKPTFPYTTKPGSLRRFLKEVPSRPKPQKFDQTVLRSWGFKDANDYSMLRVLKAVNLLNDKNEPSDLYAKFMDMANGARVLGPEIERVYAPLFEASHAPYKESNEQLKNWFNIHSGGSASALDQQIQTFKALAENAVFGDRDAVAPAASATPTKPGAAGASQTALTSAGPVVQIDLHIHLPEHKSRRDYDDIIESIGRHIYGQQKNADD